MSDLVARMEASRGAARAALAAAGRLREELDLRPLAPPRALLAQLTVALAAGGAHAEAIERHYVELMPRMRAEQLDCNDGPAALLFGAPVVWARLPRLWGAIEQLFALLPAGAQLLGARTAHELRQRHYTVGGLFAETAYGGFMPLLYGYPADLAYFARRLEDGVDAVLDRYLAAPLVHELTHFGRERAVLSLYLDECVAAWLGVRALPEFAYPAPGEDNGLYATPWFAQVGQALARVAGAARVVAAQAGVLPWREALPAGLAETLERLGREDYEATRPLHLLSDSYAPERWVKACFLAAGGVELATVGLDALARWPWTEVPPGDEDQAQDRQIVRDGLRAMCLRSFVVDGSVRAETTVPPAPITIDLAGGVITTAARADGVDQIAPRYWFPPATGARLRREGRARLALAITSAGVDVDAAVDAILCAAPARGDGWRLDDG
jgi:hypothetical protein